MEDCISSPSSDYEVQKFLGSGSYGEVLQCKKRSSNETVALKVFKHTEDIAMAKKEVELLQYLKRLGSDKFNIVTLNDSFAHRGRYCLDFEKLDMDLFDFLCMRSPETLNLKEIRPILQQLAIALDFLQSVGIVHADLKPENIMIQDHLQQPMRVKIIDFGLAVTNPENHTGAVLQTLEFRCPEVLLGAAFNSAADVWSLGCIAVELFIGSGLFPGKNEKDMIKRIVSAFGNPSDNLLNSGLHTERFFARTDGGEWTFKKAIKTQNLNSAQQKNVDFLKKVCTKTPEETEDERELASFLDLVRNMLMMDPAERISPGQILQHPFITMENLMSNSINENSVRNKRKLDPDEDSASGSRSSAGNPAKKKKEDCDDQTIPSMSVPPKRPRDEADIDSIPDQSSPKKKTRPSLKNQDANLKRKKRDSEEAAGDKSSPNIKRKRTDLS